ncbi:hypothetical protein HHI36_003464 [Cryptolaemus montrouzieri]|uniref:Adenylate cyclase n=1 Tax=Cryptolaemus montrouzieri TaxID=559131 RepID=A0ABD2PDG4_9CUCU
MSQSKSERPFKSKLKYVISNITVEPIVFLYILATMMNSLVNQNLSLEKACRVNLHLNQSICDALVVRDKSGYLPHHEVEVQQLVVKWAAYKTFIIGSIPVIAIIFFGSWSDRHRRRKPIILIPIFGDLIGSIALFVCSYFFLELSLEYSWMAETFSTGLFGGQCSLFLGVFSYVAGISSDEDRTLRIGSVAVVHVISISTGMFLSGILLNRLGFLGVYSITTLSLTVAIIYGTLKIKEKKIKEEEEKKIGFLKDLFALEYVKNTFKTCFQKKVDGRRMKMIVIMLLCTMVVGSMQGEITVQYMYVRLKFGWNEVDFSIFNFFHFAIQLLGNIIALSFFSKYMKWDDAILGVIAVVTKIFAYLVYAFAPSGKHFYVGAILELFNGSSFIALRAIMAKIVPTNELGQSNSVFGICEALMPFIFGPIYSKIYIKTMTVVPGAFYLISGGMYVIALCLFVFLYKTVEKQADHKIEEREKPSPQKIIDSEIYEKTV